MKVKTSVNAQNISNMMLMKDVLKTQAIHHHTIHLIPATLHTALTQHLIQPTTLIHHQPLTLVIKAIKLMLTMLIMNANAQLNSNMLKITDVKESVP